MKNFFLVRIPEFNNCLADCFITNMQTKFINDFINCEIWFLLNHPVNVLEIFRCQGMFTSSL